MPSGDSMQAALFAFFWAANYNFYYVFAVVPFVMLARIYYNCHYFFDTVVGVAVGVLDGWLIEWVVELTMHFWDWIK